MAEYRVNQRALMERVFGLNGLRIYQTDGPPLQDSGSKYPAITNEIVTDYDGVGLLGLPVYSNVVIPDGSYLDGSRRIDYKGITLLDPLVDISMSKVIVKTPLVKRRGSVHETITTSDYEITIRGLLVSQNRYVAPEEEIRRFNSVFLIDRDLPIECKILGWLGVYRVVIESAQLQAVPGFVNTRAFTINAISDIPIELEAI